MIERIHLRFIDYSERTAQRMLGAARAFAVTKIDGRAGIRHGTVYGYADGAHVIAYWTPSRAVVVRELPRE